MVSWFVVSVTVGPSVNSPISIGIFPTVQVLDTPSYLNAFAFSAVAMELSSQSSTTEAEHWTRPSFGSWAITVKCCWSGTRGF